MDHVNFPTDHPLYVGYQTLKHAKDADVLFFIDIDVPWEPPSRSLLRSDVKIIHLERDPLFTAVPGWGFSADLACDGMLGDIALPVLNSILKAKLTRGRT